MLVEAGGRLVPHETFRAQAVAQRRGRGPHAHRPHVDPAQGAGRSAEPDRDGVARRAIAWPCRCVSCRRPVAQAAGAPPIAAAKTLAVRPFSTGRPGRGRQLSRGRHCRRRDHGAGRACPASPSRRSSAVEDPGRRRARSAWDTCWRARCSAAPSGCSVTARLIDVASGRTEWSERFEQAPADGAALQDEIAARVATSLPRSSSTADHDAAQLSPARGRGLFPAARGARPSQAVHAAAADQGADPVRTGAGARSRLCHGACRARARPTC